MPRAANVIGYLGLTLMMVAVVFALVLLVQGTTYADAARPDKSFANKSIAPPPLHGPDYYAPPPVIPVS